MKVDVRLLYMSQGDPLAMAMYAITTIPVINRLPNENTKQVVLYADDASAAGQDVKTLVEPSSAVRTRL